MMTKHVLKSIRLDHDNIKPANLVVGKVFPFYIAVALLALFILPSIFAYGPWKPDEPYVMGTIASYMQTADWVVPTLGGEPFLEKPPLFMWVAGVMASLASPWLPIEYGARFAISFFMVITALAVGLAARRFWGVGTGRYAVVLLLAQIGIAQHGRMLISDVSQLTGCAIALLGFASVLAQPRRGGVLIGTGIGIAFLSKGLLGVGFFAVMALLLPALPKAGLIWRTRKYALGLCVAGITALPWLSIWPYALYQRSSVLFEVWFWQNNVGRFFGFSVNTLGAAHQKGHLLETVPWFTFPALPIALWVVWKWRAHFVQSAALQICVVLTLIMLVTFGISASGRVVYLMPMLLPLALLAVPGMRQLPIPFDRFAFTASAGLFSAVVLSLWFVWAVLVMPERPPFDWLQTRVPANFSLRVNLLALLGAVGFSCAWLWLVRALRDTAGRSIVAWGGGLTAAWGIAFSLLLPWIDAEKSYQPVFASLHAHLPLEANCIASVGLGESERGVLHMMGGHHTLRREIDDKSVVLADGTVRQQLSRDCDVLIVQAKANRRAPIVQSSDWHMVWTGARLGETQERFWLYRREHSNVKEAALTARVASFLEKNP
jgi:4-amino-4-deoxy-L-arabinose transferase-like glycosyltransferase